MRQTSVGIVEPSSSTTAVTFWSGPTSKLLTDRPVRSATPSSSWTWAKRADNRRGYARQQALLAFYDRHLDTEAPRHRRHLEPDVSTPDHGQPSTGCQVPAQGVCVFGGSQIEDVRGVVQGRRGRS